jgi:hypothetical protein
MRNNLDIQALNLQWFLHVRFADKAKTEVAAIWQKSLDTPLLEDD